MVLTTLPMRRNSPRSGRPSISTVIVCDRSPLATAPITRATSAVGCTMSSISSLTARIAILPAAGGVVDASALGDLAFLADHPREALELPRHLLVEVNHFVEQLRQLGVLAGKVVGQANVEVTAAENAGTRRSTCDDQETPA